MKSLTALKMHFQKLRCSESSAAFVDVVTLIRYGMECRVGLREANFPYQRTHNAVLACTLLKAGITTLYTRNLKDFEGYGFTSLVNPIDG